MKKLTMLLLAAALTLCPLFALAAQETISVYNWGDYIEPEVLDLFEQETGIKVIYETFETNEDMYAKIAMGGSSYDVIIPSDYMIERMIQENLLQKINWENIPNVANIDPRFMNEGYDPQSEYAVPYTWGTMGILYGGGDGTVYQNIAAAFNGISGYSFLVFNLLCAPCFAAIGAIKREMNSQKWTWFAIGYQCGFAYAIALMVNQFGALLTGSGNVLGVIVGVALLAVIVYMLVKPYKEATKLTTKIK